MKRGRPKTAAAASTNQILALRERAGLSIEQLAELCDCSTSTIQRAESGTRGIGEDLLFKLAKAFKVTPGEVYGCPETADPIAREILSLAKLMPSKKRELWLEVGRGFLNPSVEEGAGNEEDSREVAA